MEDIFSLILSLDTKLFLIINHLPHNLIFDGLMLFFTFLGWGGIIWLAAGFILSFKKKKRANVIYLIFFGISMILIVDLFLKPFVGRQRPFILRNDVFIPGRLLTNGFSFPSGHAFSAFAFIPLLSFWGKKLKKPLFILALLIAFSRVYLGRHYPLDVFAGGVLGYIYGLGGKFLWQRIFKNVPS